MVRAAQHHHEQDARLEQQHQLETEEESVRDVLSGVVVETEGRCSLPA